MTGKTQLSWKQLLAWAEPRDIRVKKYQIVSYSLNAAEQHRVLVAHVVWPCSVCALQQLMLRNPRDNLHQVSCRDAAWT